MRTEARAWVAEMERRMEEMERDSCGEVNG